MNAMIRCAKLATLWFVVVVLVACAGPQRAEREARDKEAVQNRVAAGMEYLHQGQLNEARQHFSRALERDGSSPVAHNAMALLYKYEGDLEREEHHYKRALRLDKSYTAARNNYGILLFQRGDFAAAKKEFEIAANDPKYGARAGAFENLARSCMALEQYREAIRAFQRALRLGQPEASILPDLVEAYIQDGQPEYAREYFEQYLDLQEGKLNTAQALWLGIRVAAYQQNSALQYEYEQQLQREFSKSAEYKLWQQWRD